MSPGREAHIRESANGRWSGPFDEINDAVVVGAEALAA
jgi:hypothetical protein